MKLTFLLSMFLFSFSAFAWNEVECDVNSAGKQIRVEIERSFPSDSPFKRAELTVVENGSQRNDRYTVTRRAWGSRWEYTGGGLRLEVDIWPDRAPHWGRTYRGTLLSSQLGNQYVHGLRCRFPSI